MISEFKNKYFFLSNFYRCSIIIDEKQWPTIEHIFQAAKTTDLDKREYIRNLKFPKEAKQYSKKIDLRSDWEKVKYDIMYGAVYFKFNQNKDLASKLISTNDQYLIEGNYRHDNIWGNCYCDKCKNSKGQNLLGEILMKVRKDIWEEKYVK